MRCEVVLEAVGVQLPKEEVSTAQIEAALAPTLARWSLPKGQLQALTGIVTRRFWPHEVSLSKMGAFAVMDALTRCHVPPSAIGALIYASVCREAKEPATATLVAYHLQREGLALPEHAELFDLSNACLGALNAMLVLARRIERQEIRAGVVVLCESAREIVATAIASLQQARDLQELTPHLATLTGGSGACALVLSDGSFSPYEDQATIVGGVCQSAVQHAQLCRWETLRTPIVDEGTQATPFGGPYALCEQMRTDSVPLLAHGVSLGQTTFAAFLDEMRWQRSDLALSICHQVGKTHQDKILAALELDPQRDHCTYPGLGNTGSAAVALTLADAIDQGRLERGDKVALLGIGSGLNCMMIGLQW